MDVRKFRGAGVLLALSVVDGGRDLEFSPDQSERGSENGWEHRAGECG